MIFSLFRQGTSRCQLRHLKPSCVSTSSYRHLSGNSTDVFAEHSFLQSTLTIDLQDNSTENPQPRESGTGYDGPPHWPTYGELDASRAPAYVDSVRSSQERKSHTLAEPGPQQVCSNAPQSTQNGSSETAGDMSFPDGLVVKQGESFADTKNRLSRAMREGDPQSLLLEFWEATREPTIMRAIPQSTFLEILRMLDPEDEFAPFRREYSEPTPKHYMKLQDQTLKLYKTMKDHRTLYQDIWNRRLRANQGMDVREYAALLRLARATWNGGGALAIMKDMLRRNVKPDLICYNYYFEARCWSDAWQPTERQRLRVIPFTKIVRRRSSAQQWQGMTINGHKIEEEGLKREITRLFTKMIDDGITADTTAFGHLITALAREGDLLGVKSILLKAWKVDVNAIAEIEDDIQEETPIPRDSPLYPNSKLLFVIAHAFGSNNDLPAAIRIVDHFSRKFDLTIPSTIWGQLLEWAFVLSTRRHKDCIEEGTQLGQLPPQSVESLFNVMTSEPYCIKPTLDMYDFLIRSFYRQSELDTMLEYIPKGVEIHRKHEDDYKKHVVLVSELESWVPMAGIANDLAFRKRLADVADSRRHQSFVTIQKWFSLLRSRRHWFPLTRDTRVIFWERQGLPNAVQIYRRYSDRRSVKYSMATGIVELRVLSERSKPTWNLNREAESDEIKSGKRGLGDISKRSLTTSPFRTYNRSTAHG